MCELQSMKRRKVVPTKWCILFMIKPMSSSKCHPVFLLTVPLWTVKVNVPPQLYLHFITQNGTMHRSIIRLKTKRENDHFIKLVLLLDSYHSFIMIECVQFGFFPFVLLWCLTLQIGHQKRKALYVTTGGVMLASVSFEVELLLMDIRCLQFL